MFRVAFTGYRPQKLPFFGEDDPLFIDLLKRLRGQIVKFIEDGATEFISGMALGVDTYCAEIVLDLQKQYPNITLFAAIPCADQARLWSTAQQEHYRELLSKCNSKKVLAEHYTKGCMNKRNRFMVDNCDILLAVYDGKPGGTMDAVKYASGVGRKIIVVPPVL